MSWELGQPARDPYQSYTPFSYSLSLLGNHEEDSRTGLSGRGAAFGIGNVFSSLIHSVARNPSLAKQSFGYAILGFALTEAIASFAPFFASKPLFDLIRIPIWLKFHSYNYLFEADSSQCSFYRYCKKANSCFHSIFITKMYHVRIRCSN